ncbi:hypothetical protein B0H10DRAFT_2052311 [Mycena sp. CBHHK59/15]|nr:hypothetical protein B0H10DRAFT_2052311 [Mycena sp. CBHHK59/15]
MKSSMTSLILFIQRVELSGTSPLRLLLLSIRNYSDIQYSRARDYMSRKHCDGVTASVKKDDSTHDTCTMN